MPEPAASNDHIERANTQFWNPPSLEELMADVAPLEPNEHFDISRSTLDILPRLPTRQD